MKAIHTFLTLLLGISFSMPQLEARTFERNGKNSREAAPQKRSPMTGSKIQRPQTRPAPTPAARPQLKPAARPESRPSTRPAPSNRPASRPPTTPQTRPAERPPVQKPSVQKPATRPAPLPAGRPEANRPGTTKPAPLPGNVRPTPDRPGTTKPAPLPGNVRPTPDRPGTTKPAPLPGNVRPTPDRPGTTKPAPLPGNVRPGANRPEQNRPEQSRPGGGRPELARPDNRPSLQRPGTTRPSTLPGMVTYPNRPDKGRPGGGDRNNVYIDNSRTRNETHITKVNVNRRNVGLNRPATLPSNNRNWDTRKWGGNKSVWGNRVNVQNNYNVRIDNNFRRSNNYAYRPNYWGARPWWGAGHCHSWHHGHWQYGWNNSYYRRHWYYKDNNDFAQGFMWGITAWSLGNLVYNMGYKTYTNPYPAPPVQTSVSTTPITYTQPVSAAAAEIAPGDDAQAELAETKSDEALARSRAAFQQGDYLAASKAVDEAIGHTPGDVTLHEYRALVFFALGKYSDAAGVLNPVLASGPGWGWDTMIALYNSSDTYAEQLRRLEEWVNGSPESADARFLLGYHYMVCGHMDQAYEQFSKASELQPADSISRQLRDLTGSSIPDGGAADDVEAPERPEPVPAEALAGTWTSDNGAGGKITFRMEDAGDFLWVYEADGRTSEMKGTYGLDDKGLLILTTDDTQMVSAVEIKDGKLVFTLVGAPDGDSGLIFAKK